MKKPFAIKNLAGNARKKISHIYPIRLIKDKEILKKYIEKAKTEEKVTFVGRLGTYRYLDMDVTIKKSLEIAEIVKLSLNNNVSLIPFYINMDT